MTVHFRPPGGYVGDLIPFERDGRLWLFYLLDERRDPPTGMPWALASTEDFVNYTDHGVVLPSGGADAADYDCYTGCVIDDGDQLHLFYTGHNPARRTTAGDLQVVCHATSDGDLTQWRKHPDHTFGAPTGYLPEDWRDPYVYRVTPNEPWQLILAARHTEGPDRRRGVVARLTSTDLVTWHPTTPLWDPHRFITQECPEVFQWGDWWYLVYSEFSDAFQTRYRIAAGPDGPWLAPERDSVDGRARYASKSVARGDRRFFVGWIATRAGDRDDGDWEWAGELAALEATQETDGTLGFGLPPELVASFAQSETVQLVPVDGAAARPRHGRHGSVRRVARTHPPRSVPRDRHPRHRVRHPAVRAAAADRRHRRNRLRTAAGAGPQPSGVRPLAARPHRTGAVAGARGRPLRRRTRATVPVTAGPSHGAGAARRIGVRCRRGQPSGPEHAALRPSVGARRPVHL